MNKQTVQSAEMNILYSLSQVIDKILMDAERRGLVRPNLELIREKKILFRRVSNCVQGAFRAIEEINKDIEQSASADYRLLDEWAVESNEMCRLLLLYYDKCDKNVDNANAVFKFLRSLEGEGIITESDLDRFRLKK